MGTTCLSARADEVETISLLRPVPYQVVQREGFVPRRAAPNEPGGPVLGFADIVITTNKSAPPDSRCEGRAVPLEGAVGKGVDWRVLERVAKTDSPDSTPQDGFSTALRIPAGGWYRIELRWLKEGDIVARGVVEPVGVGEVFIVAGQSYATNCNDEQFKVTDQRERVAAYDSASGQWRVAHDPQPTPDGSTGGSIWPPLGELLLPATKVPIGFANVAVGATSSSQWLPEGKLHERLVKTGRALGRFRAVLWQQGESDVIGKVSTEQYVKNVTAIRAEAVKVWKFEPPWLLAKSTLHPTVYTDPEGETRIRRGIDKLTELTGFVTGPDTDTLAGENRGDRTSRRHFSGIGQRRAASLWFASVYGEIHRPRPDHEAALAMLPDLHLLEPAWTAPIVHRESSVLLQLKEGGPTTARLAFAAGEILSISTADRQHRFELGRDVTLSSDGLTLTFADPQPLPSISSRDFFPPKDAPHSYRHRAGHPDLNMLYRPGRWFHDRNIEVSYRRAKLDEPAATKESALPKTMARLRAELPLTVGISGDSISTGLDASGLTFAPPYSPGYPDLVAAQLQATFKSPIALKNRAVSGWSVANGLQDLDTLLAERPQLVIVAYGMNDVGRRDPSWFGKQTRELVERIRRADAETEIILVAPMLGHSEWVHTPREMFAKYRDELRAHTGPGVALADLTSVWELLLKNKHDLDLTGNGLNHPNDFGHRLYAQAILALVSP